MHRSCHQPSVNTSRKQIYSIVTKYPDFLVSDSFKRSHIFNTSFIRFNISFSVSEWRHWRFFAALHHDSILQQQDIRATTGILSASELSFSTSVACLKWDFTYRSHWGLYSFQILCQIVVALRLDFQIRQECGMEVIATFFSEITQSFIEHLFHWCLMK